ncbi:MAG TPA: DUF2917 domain-containing protein [Paraburkholderia sp.]|uniref:DUF2917 domain-containing protein n=1 Tax=Paraburkholderia sp. TaxID=1926495 RepID=UPI002B6416DD|nr:DUF2917 domain-containing protein [Paraburkholderia sp.]HTR11232.1 DUF2917 domain-containing protein [Paraburkholderia sp.]
MREIRIFELEHGEPVETWRLAQAMQLHVSEGELWLTIAGDAGDYWLRAGESIDLMAGVRVHVSAGREGARFVLALGGATAEAPAWALAPGAAAHARATGSRGFAARVGEALRAWAQRGQWGARAAG